MCEFFEIHRKDLIIDIRAHTQESVASLQARKVEGISQRCRAFKRQELREAYLAYGYLRNVPYEKIERNMHVSSHWCASYEENLQWDKSFLAQYVADLLCRKCRALPARHQYVICTPWESRGDYPSLRESIEQWMGAR